MHFILRRFFILLLALPLVCAPAAAQTPELSREDEQQSFYLLLSGYMIAAGGDYKRAAPLIGGVGIIWRDGDILASAVQTAIQAGDINQAKQYAAVWASIDNAPLARQIQAELEIAAGQWATAAVLLHRLMAEGLQSQEDLFRQLNEVDDPAQALAMGRRLFSADADGRYYLALLAFSKQAFADANIFVTEALEADGGRLDILFLAGRIAQLAEGDGAPLPIMRRFAEGGCSDAVAHCELDGVLWAFADYLRGGQQWREGLAAPRPDKAQWAVSAGNWYEQWQMPAAARAAYLRAGEDFMAQTGLARLAEDAGDLDEAIRILQNAAVASSGELVTRETVLADLLMQAGQPAAALARLTEAQKTVPDNFSLIYQHSLLLEQQGDIAGALALLRRLTALFPDNAAGWNALGYVMADNNIDLKDAERYIDRALQASPEDPNIIDSLGWVYYRMGNLAGARLQLQKAAAASDSPEIHAHYGEVLWEMGDLGEARRVWRQAKARAPDNEVLNETLSRYQPF